MSGNKEISKETKPEIQPKVVDDGAEASNSVSEERVAPSGLASLVGEDLLDSDEDDGSFNGEESGSGDDSERDSEDENTEEASSETEKRATLNNLNDEQLFGLGASTGHNDNESESDSENDDEDEESEENSTEQPVAKSAKKRQADEAGDTDTKKTKHE